MAIANKVKNMPSICPGKRNRLNFVVFNRFLYPGEFEGMFFTLFAIAIAAAETALAIAIIINIYRAAKGIDVRSLDEMKF